MHLDILVHLERCLGCHTCELACAVQHSHSGSLLGAVVAGELPVSRIQVEAGPTGAFPLQCRHCSDPVCVKACMAGALYRAGELVMQHEERCVGCWMCVMVCPYGAIVSDSDKEKALKCDRCGDRELPACTESCPTGALAYQEVDNYSRDKRKEFLTNFVLKEES